MRKSRMKWLACLLTVFTITFVFIGSIVQAESINQQQFVYDEAGVLTTEEKAQLEELAKTLGEENETAFLVITTNSTDKDIEPFVEDFYDDNAPGYDKPHGNTAILAIDLTERDIYLAVFKKAETYLDDSRLTKIREKITPNLSSGNYYTAFSDYMNTAHDYMGYEPGVNPDNPLFLWWVQLIIALAIAGVAVGLMAYSSGGRVTVGAETYSRNDRTSIVGRHDRYIRTTVTKVKKPKPSNNGGGGGGITGGGHSHSGSRGKF